MSVTLAQSTSLSQWAGLTQARRGASMEAKGGLPVAVWWASGGSLHPANEPAGSCIPEAKSSLASLALALTCSTILSIFLFIAHAVQFAIVAESGPRILIIALLISSPLYATDKLVDIDK